MTRDKREYTERNQRIAKLRREGQTFERIGSAFGISAVRVFRIVARESERSITKPALG